jgi:hypothetical protein
MKVLKTHRNKFLALVMVLAAAGMIAIANVGEAMNCPAGYCAGGPGHPNECIAPHTCHEGVNGGYIICLNGQWQYMGCTPIPGGCQGTPCCQPITPSGCQAWI